MFFSISTTFSSSGGGNKQQGADAKSAKAATSSGEGSRKSSGGVRRKPKGSGPSKSKKEKLYCICQTPYDDSKYARTIFIQFKLIAHIP